MKTLRLIVLSAVLAQALFVFSAKGQVYSPRRITERVVPQPHQPASPNPRAAPVPGLTNARPGAPGVTAPPVPLRPAVRIVPPRVDPEKAKAAKEATVRRTVEFQKKRASEGSESAQYELGLRYLKGDGVEKDEVTGRKWLESSAKAGYSPAVKKLQDLDKPAAPVRQE